MDVICLAYMIAFSQFLFQHHHRQTLVYSLLYFAFEAGCGDYASTGAFSINVQFSKCLANEQSRAFKLLNDGLNIWFEESI